MLIPGSLFPFVSCHALFRFVCSLHLTCASPAFWFGFVRSVFSLLDFVFADELAQAARACRVISLSTTSRIRGHAAAIPRVYISLHCFRLVQLDGAVEPYLRDPWMLKDAQHGK